MGMKRNKITKYIVNCKNLVIKGFILCFIVMALGIVSPIITAKLINVLAQVDLERIIVMALFVFLLALLTRAFTYFFHEIWRKLQHTITLNIEEDVTSRLFALETKNFDIKGTGFFLNRLRQEPNNMTNEIISLRDYIMNIITGLGVLVLIITINVYMALYMIAGSFVICFIAVLKSNKKYVLVEKEKNLKEKDTTSFGEIIKGIRDIKTLNFKNAIIQKAVERQEEINVAKQTTAKVDHRYDIIWKIFMAIFDLFLLVIGVFLIKNNQLSGANLLVLYFYSGRILELTMQFSFIYDAINEYKLAKSRLFEVIDGRIYKKEAFGEENIEKIEGHIDFVDVNFAYDDTLVLKKMNLSIKPNETIGIVGKSGAGKTTIFNLLSKLYTVTDGKILLDGVNINDLTETSIRKNITTITQNPYVFNMSIRDNLKIVNPQITDEQMIEKAKMTNLDEFVSRSKDGYDTIIGEGGVTISGGQKQRIAITRALLKDSEIILLDEATNSLDNKTQKHIHESLKRISKDYTILIIAHRLSTIEGCDRILVIDDGKVVASGKHESLLKKSKIYKELYEAEKARNHVTK